MVGALFLCVFVGGGAVVYQDPALRGRAVVGRYLERTWMMLLMVSSVES